jgi:hypothetical protein
MLEFAAHGIVKMQEEVFDTCEGKAEEFGDEDLEFGQEEDADFKEFEDFSRRRSGRFRRIRRLCQLRRT